MTTRQIIAVDEFADVREQAFDAFAKDPDYVVSMAKTANTILNKRALWSLRLELRKAETQALRDDGTAA